ncbi:VOC family protein [Bifidobacterium phasiani]|uniref:VOC family protein n=1 Tax=Bifidobacterium phasiani TaxID=2834431 RepID=A0ABS6WA77_9BIFI|nr:VOC family protein [Bifidobacterium phasiani]MBW3082652.1 VOC family protein [Bifidobacterium phasiani]
MNKITCICLGVRDMRRSVRFYRDGLGFRATCADDEPGVCFFDTPGTKFELFPLDGLAKDIGGDDPPRIADGFGGITLTYNVERRNEVDEVIGLVRRAGGTVVKEPQDVFWGGYHAYFADPDGYYWEVAWGPDFRYDEDGLLRF